MEITTGQRAWVPVWDLFVRVFHWGTAAGFAAAYLSGEFKANELHILVGYAVTLLLIARLVWGFIGTPYARFSALHIAPADVVRYLKSLRTAHPLHYAGHNPLGALMVVALLCMLTGICASGLIILGAIEFEGPLQFLTATFSDHQAYTARDIHELLAKITLVLVALHILGAISASIQHRENLIRAMITGKKFLPPASEGDNNDK